MSKSPNLFFPALGVTGIVLGTAYGVSTRGYKATEAEHALAAAEAAKARVELQVAENSDLQSKIEAVQAEAAAKLAELEAMPASSGAASAPAPESEARYGLGRPALTEEIAAWDVDVLPDGRGLPEGSGDVLTGEEVFIDRCASCHGDFAEGLDNWPVLAGGFDTLADEDPVKTVGSYWPYLSTVWDYVHRSMPFGEAQTLTADETYAITAYILYSNDLVDEEFTLSRETFLDVEMHNADGFVIDDRAEVEYAAMSGEPCMENCKDGAEITRRSSSLNVTPLDEFMHPAMHGKMAEEVVVVTPDPEKPVEPVVEPAVGNVVTALDPEMLAAGEKAFRRCKSCHQVGDNAKNKTGPNLNNVLGRTIGSVEGFKYSKVFQEAAAAGETWNAENMAAFLAKPKNAMKGTKMNFSGVKNASDIQALLVFLQAQVN